MAYNFNGTTDVISATITAVDTGDWTICAWVYPETVGEASLGRILAADNGTAFRQNFSFTSTGTIRLEAQQRYAGTNAKATTADNAVALNAWSFVVGTFNSSTAHCAVYVGDLDSAVAAVSLGTDNAGSSTRQTGGTTLRMGNNSAGGETFDGKIEHAFFFKRLLSTAEMEAIRLGWRPAPDTTNLAAYYPLTADAKDRSGNSADGTVTGAVLASGPTQLPSAAASADPLTASAATADSLTLTPA